MNELAAIAFALTVHAPVTPAGFDAESPEAFEERMTTIAKAGAAVSRTLEELAAVDTVIEGESSFDRWVHEGRVHPNPKLHQDHFRARCLMQVHQNARFAPDLDALGGTDLDATTRCLTAGVRLLRSAAFMCTHGMMLGIDDMERVFAAYKNSGVSCAPTMQSKARARRWAAIRARLWRAN